jgi:hypothetical protein
VAGTIVPSSSAIYVVCGQGTIFDLEGAQVQGRRRVTGLDFANGIHLMPGERFGA